VTLARKAHKAKKATVAPKALLAHWVPLVLPVRKVNKAKPVQWGRSAHVARRVTPAL
jgi:hypothetical protein